jgi:hypothetical protein
MTSKARTRPTPLTPVTKPRFFDESTILFGVMENSQGLWNATVAMKASAGTFSTS